jgi:hypothetical protein
MADQSIPLKISIAPFPEGFEGDMDETFQQACVLMSATVEGQFLTGLVLPPGSTLPTTDQGVIMMDGIWYFWDDTTGQYLPQGNTAKPAKNYAKNPIYQVQQTGSTITPPAGTSPVFDMALCRCVLGTSLAVSADVGPIASGVNDDCVAAIKYTVGPTLATTLGATDLYAHEHLIEGSDIAMLQGQLLTVSFFVWCNQPGNYSAYLTSTGRDQSYVQGFTVTAAGTWQRVVMPAIPAMPTSGTWTYGEGATGIYIGVAFGVGTQWLTTTPGAWQGGFFAGTSKTSNLMAVINNQIKISGVKLEAAAAPSYLSVPSFEADLHDAIRYYYSTFSYQSSTLGAPISMVASSVGGWAASFVFPRRMCKTPVVTPYGYASHNKGNITDISVNPPFDIPVASLAAVPKGVAATGVSTINTTGTTNATTTITGIPSTVGISIGASVTGSGIPPGTTVASILSSTSITLSASATTSLVATALIFTNFSTFSTTGTTNSFSTTGTTDGTTTSITAIPSTATLATGMPVSGTGIPAGATVTSIVSGTAITISIPTNAAGTGVALVFGTNSITAIPTAARSQMAVGMPISGTGIPAGATIATLASSTSITISGFLTAFGAGVGLTVGLFNKGDTFWAFINADARLT